MSDTTISMNLIITASSLIPTDFDTYDVTFVDGEGYKIDMTKRKEVRQAIPSWWDYLPRIEIRPHAIGTDHDWFRVKIFTSDPNEFNRRLSHESDRHTPLLISTVDSSLQVQVHIDDMHDHWLEKLVRVAMWSVNEFLRKVKDV